MYTGLTYFSSLSKGPDILSGIPTRLNDKVQCKLQALVYNILPPTTAIIDYTIGLWKLSANRQFSIGAQMEVSL